MAEQMIELVVSGIDVENDDVRRVISGELSEFAWGVSNGVTTVAQVGDLGDFVCAAEAMAKRVFEAFPEVPIAVRWNDDLVTTTAVADRTGVTREAVRLWAKALRGTKDFPAPFAMIPLAEKASPVWRWARISEWLDAHGYVGDGVQYPTDRDIALINARLSAGRGIAQNARLGLTRLRNFAYAAGGPGPTPRAMNQSHRYSEAVAR